jgi:hypothetical protein
MYHFTAIFDHNYITRAKILLLSLKQTNIEFTFYAVALTPECERLLETSNIDNLIIISLNEIEIYYPELSDLKKERDRTDYIFTLSPYYPLYILSKYDKIPHICSLDVDQYFFSSPSPIFDDLKTHSILITPHRFSTELLKQDMLKHGKYNVSFQVFKNNKIGLSCLELWRKQCKQWCYDRLEENLFADQKYLDLWEAIFPKEVKPISNIGLGLAPWNINQYKLKFRNEQLFIDDTLLILYHYQGLRILEGQLFDTRLDKYHVTINKNIVEYIYQPIIETLSRYQLTPDQIIRSSGKVDLKRKGIFCYKNDKLVQINNLNILDRIIEELRKI